MKGPEVFRPPVSTETTILSRVTSLPRNFRNHHAPERSGDRLIDPPIDRIEPLVDNNQLLRTAFNWRVNDLNLWELVAAARREVLTVAAEYTSSYRDIHRPDDMADWVSRPIIMGGHQPDLFHPGVWLKNFVIDRYARSVGGTAINLVVDTDRCASTTLSVPMGTFRESHFESVAMDDESSEMPWEERAVLDPELFASFGQRASDLLSPLVPDAILRRWWPLVVERTKESHRLGLGLAQARHCLEARWGLQTLELPVSELVRLPTVMLLFGHLLAHARELNIAYNESLADFRLRTKQRGQGRPVPDLAIRANSEEEWIEVPFWIWSREDPRRRRVFAIVAAPGVLTLSDLETIRVELPIATENPPSRWVDALARLEEHGLRLRPRALITTLVARLLVADVFVHGIGGALYDQLTDDIVRRLTGCDPPGYAVVSGTLRLNIPPAGNPAADLATLHSELRDLEFHPERHLEKVGSLPDELHDLVVHKSRWINTFPTATLAKRRCREIRAANDRMGFYLKDYRNALLLKAGPLATALRASKVMASRELPWCFFPEKALKNFLVLENHLGSA